MSHQRREPDRDDRTTPAGVDGLRPLEAEELDIVELPDREALSVFTGGIGHIRIDPPGGVEGAPPDPSSET
jgi:hypothetical protein